MITMASLFDGSGGFSLASVLNGITPIWASEIEPYPLKVTAARFPDMKQYGDVTKINGAEVEPVDIITFGSPCQDLSVAGERKGIHEGERSNLFLEAIRIIKEMRENDRPVSRTDNVRPRFAVWENVPGAFSSNKGEDFRAVLEAFASICENRLSISKPKKWNHAGVVVGNGWSLAWRIYDAQYWGVPQRRKRIYLIADFGSERAGQILFKPESVYRDSAEGREAGQRTAKAVEGCARKPSTRTYVPSNTSRMTYNEADKAATLNTGYYYGSGGDAVMVLDARGNGSGTICPTITGDHQNRITDYTAICIGNGQAHTASHISVDICQTLNCMHDQQIVCYEMQHASYVLRRLTPLECCRLQGFPDWWEEGVEGSDSARYRMWGNGIALPCAVDVMRRIAEEMKGEENEQSMVDR